ncbi:MAG: DUF4340 domain-containing protein [Treponema sp.]|jgi:hypothetical protein|nr:DUF4340 domain-containing protein [Treponema sp.]
MTYNRKVLILSIITATLALIYAGTFILAPERLNSRSSAYTWLESKLAEQAGRIEISQGGETLALVSRNALWYVETDGKEYPAKQGRIADLLRLITSRGAYPLRGSAVSSQERLGVGEDASHIVVRNGAGEAPLLDLLVGGADATGREVYLRKNGQNEVRSGENKFTAYLSPAPSAWYNLRLFPQEGTGALSLDMVQRVSVAVPPASGEDAPVPPFLITKSGQGWAIEGVGVDEIDISKVDAYIRNIIDAEGDGFVTSMTVDEPVFNEGSVHIELGDGSTRTVKVGPFFLEGEGETGKRTAVVSGSPYVYTLAEWIMSRLFRDAAYFKKSEEINLGK